METYLTRITDYLLAQSWQIALLVVVIAAVSLVLRNKSAHVRYLLWLIVLAKCLVPPLLTVPVAILPQEESVEPVPISPPTGMPAMDSEVVDTTIAEPLELPSTLVKTAPAPMVSRRPTKTTIHKWLGAGWMVGITVFLVFNLLKALRASLWLWRQRKALPAELLSDIENLFSAHGIKSSPGVWQIDGISQPFVWGLLRGSIYLPADLLSVKNSKRCKSLLGHELSHIIRFDAAVNFLQVIVQAIFWFHPFVWWANRKIRAEREKCCDEMAIARLNTSPRDYSTAIVETLVAKYESTRPVPSLAVAGPVKNIEERIKTMMKPGKKFYKRPSLVTATIVLLLALLTVPTALVLTARADIKATPGREGKPNPLGKLEYIDHLTREDLFGVASVETSPDGKFAYATAYNASSVVVFKRDKETGYLEHVQTISDREDLNGAVSARVTPDGRYVVCTAFRSNTVSLFDRDKLTGTLKMLDIVKQDERGGQGLTWVIDSAISPDSKFVYTVADLGRGQRAALSVFRITAQRKLQLVQELVQTNVGENKYFLGARGIAISPKGDSVYVASHQASTLVVLDRDAKSGKTKVRQIIKDEKGDVHGLGGAFAVTCSPDGKFIYTSAGRWEGDNAICVFKKTANGTLSLVQEIFDGKDGVTGFVGGNELKVSPDGRNVYAAGSRSNSVVVFSRNVKTGELTYLQTFYNSEVAGKDGDASGIEISPDGEYVYVAGDRDNSILIFKRLTGTKKGPEAALHSAASSGDIAQVKSLIAGGAEVNRKGKRGFTALHWAVKANRKDAAKLLISAGVNVNARTGSQGWTPLHIAVMNGNKEMTKWLLNKEADINAQNKNNALTALLIAITTNKPDIAETLLENGADIATSDGDGKTPLHKAAGQGRTEIARLLITKGADVNPKNDWGATPLHYASMYGHTSVAQLLIEKGAEVRAKTNYDWTPLLYAARAGSKHTVELLLSKGADVNAEDNQGSVLWWAERAKRAEIVELLRKHGAKE